MMQANPDFVNIPIGVMDAIYKRRAVRNYAPILLGYPAGDTPLTNRKPPAVLCWKKPTNII